MLHDPRCNGGELRYEQTRRELVELGGQDQIPFLVDHRRERTIYESDDIVEYLQDHSGRP